MATQVRIEGLEKLDAALKALPAKIERKILRQVGKEVAADLEASLKAVAPQGSDLPHPKYGRLRENIASKSSYSFKTKTLRVTVGFGKAFWWRFLEYGTAERVTRKPRRAVGRIAARPFARPLWDSSKQEVLDKFISALKSKLGSVVKP